MSMAQSRATRSAAKARSVRNADWAFHASDAAVFAALASGRRVASLREYFGAPAYAELCSLAAAKKKAPAKNKKPARKKASAVKKSAPVKNKAPAKKKKSANKKSAKAGKKR